MGQDLPRIGDQVIDTMTEIFHWLGKQVEQFISHPSAPPFPSPADMSDRQLLLVRCIRQSESFAAAWLVEGVGRVEYLGGASEA
jgi:hypothetical protein